MPFYDQIDERTPEGKRTLEGLERLRRQLEDPDEGDETKRLPARNLNDTLLLATWNIREFDSAAYGCRSDEAIQYIAEIISRFDVVAIQEVRGDLEAMERLCARLGSWWDYIVSDVTEGRAGNDERMAFLYFTSVYRPEDEALYAKEMGDRYTEVSPGKPRKDKSRYYLNY